MIGGNDMSKFAPKQESGQVNLAHGSAPGPSSMGFDVQRLLSRHFSSRNGGLERFLQPRCEAPPLLQLPVFRAKREPDNYRGPNSRKRFRC